MGSEKFNRKPSDKANKIRCSGCKIDISVRSASFVRVFPVPFLVSKSPWPYQGTSTTLHSHTVWIMFVFTLLLWAMILHQVFAFGKEVAETPGGGRSRLASSGWWRTQSVTEMLQFTGRQVLHEQQSKACDGGASIRIASSSKCAVVSGTRSKLDQRVYRARIDEYTGGIAM